MYSIIMINRNKYNIVNNSFPLDKCVIQTHNRLKDVVGDCPADKLDTLPPEIRYLVHKKRNDAKPMREDSSTNSKLPIRYNPVIPTCEIFIRSFQGIKLHAERDPLLGWYIYQITFNPGGVCHGHNGRVINEDHFIHACSYLIESVAPLLVNFDHGIHLVPGLVPHGRASWKSLEIPFHILDPNGWILRAFTNAKHKDINLDPVYKCNKQSIAFANSTNDLVIRVYRKDLELRKKQRGQVTNDDPVLRIEVQLSGAKLKKYLNSGVWELMDGESRLINFRGDDLRSAHHAVMSEFSGALSIPPSVVGQKDNKIGRMMGYVASKTDLSLRDQLSYYNERFLGGNSPASVRNTMSILGIAARKELSLQSTVSLSELISDEAWNDQPDVVCSKLEAMLSNSQQDVAIHPIVKAIYGSPRA